MKLNDLDKKTFANQALRENYNVSFNCSKMTMNETKTMLKKVRSLAMEAKQSNDYYQTSANPAFMKLVFMEQALVSHYNNLVTRQPRIVVENEEVEKSQVILAAQDVVDSIQKMVEEVSDMQVKELPALVNSIQSEIGVNESEQYNSEVSSVLSTLLTTLNQTRDSVQQALNGLTGAESAAPANAFDTGAEMGAEAGADAAADMGAEMGAELGAEALPPPPEEPESGEPNVGRPKRA